MILTIYALIIYLHYHNPDNGTLVGYTNNYSYCKSIADSYKEVVMKCTRVDASGNPKGVK